MPRSKLPISLLHPAQLNTWQALGDFLSRFDCEGVVLICQAQGKLYPFGQWSTVFGKCFVLGWCRFLDQAPYDAAWYESLPGPGLAPTEPVGETLSLANLTDEQVVARFVEQVACAGAILAYLGEEYNPTFWRWRTEERRVVAAINDSLVQVHVVGEGREASSVSATDNAAFTALHCTIKSIFPQVLVAPYVVVAATDAWAYASLCPEATYRFMPVLMDQTTLESLHGTNEQLRPSAYLDGIQFYVALIKNFN